MQRYRTLVACAAFAALAPHTDHAAAYSAPTFADDTFLYSAEAPEGRLFAAGQRHPGEGWHDHPRDVPVAVTAADAGSGFELRLADAASELETARGEVGDLRAQLADQEAKFNQSWDRLKGEKATADAENADLRNTITSRDEDIRQLQAQVEELTAPAADPDEAKSAAGKPSK